MATLILLFFSELFVHQIEISSIIFTRRNATPAWARNSTGHAWAPKQLRREHILKSRCNLANSEKSTNPAPSKMMLIDAALWMSSQLRKSHVTYVRETRENADVKKKWERRQRGNDNARKQYIGIVISRDCILKQRYVFHHCLVLPNETNKRWYLETKLTMLDWEAVDRPKWESKERFFWLFCLEFEINNIFSLILW